MDSVDILKLKPTGASESTAAQDKLNCSGVEASEKMAETDLERMDEYKDIIISVGQQKRVPPAIIAGIISRESRAGNTIKDLRPETGCLWWVSPEMKPGWGDNNKAFGLMQIDVWPVEKGGGGHTPRGEWNSSVHIAQATDILVEKHGLFRDWTQAQQLQGALAAYNMGEGYVHSYDQVDANTTGRDYSNDVVARAQWYKRHHGYYYDQPGRGGNKSSKI